MKELNKNIIVLFFMSFFLFSQTGCEVGGKLNENVALPDIEAICPSTTFSDLLTLNFGTVDFQLKNMFYTQPEEGWTALLTNQNSDLNLNGTHLSAFSLSAFDNVLEGQIIESAPKVYMDVYIADEAIINAASITFAFDGANGKTSIQNLDLISWILNQNFRNVDNGDGISKNYTDGEIQGAIWGLTDGFTFVPSGAGLQANADEIYNLAVANGEGYIPNLQNGEKVPVLLYPTGDDYAPDDHTDPFITLIEPSCL